MSERKKSGNNRNGNFYGAPDQSPGRRINDIGNVTPSRQQSFEDTQPYNIGGQQQYRQQNYNRQFQRPASPDQQYQGQPYQQGQPYPGQQYPGQQPPPQNNYYGNQQPYPYGGQYYPPRNEEPEEKHGSKATLILIIVTLVLILGIAGGGILFLLKKEDGSNKTSSGSNAAAAASESSAETEADTTDEATTEEESTEVKPDFVEVPKVVGSEITVARLKFEEAGITAAEEYEFSDKVKKDYVISQSIPEGTKVSSDTEIVIVISKGSKNGDLIVVPDVTGLNYTAAAEKLEKLKLKCIVDEKRDDPSVGSGTVISQNIAPKNKVQKGTAVHLVISSGDTATMSRTGTVVTEETALNIRKGPSYDAEIIGTLDRGETITITAESGNWYFIEHNGIQGYVSRDYIRID